MDRKEYIKRHRMMWEEISEHMKDLEERKDEILPIKGEFEGVDASVYFWNLKIEIIESLGNDPFSLHNKCYLCEYASKRSILRNYLSNNEEGKMRMCDCCPVEFTPAPINDEYLNFGITTNICLGGLYVKFMKRLALHDYEAASILAEEIAHLPERKKEVKIT